MKKSRSRPKKRDYTVGKGRPPVHTQFKPGQSGNPRGRPKGSPNLEAFMGEFLKKKFPVKEGGKVRYLFPHEIMIRQMAAKAMKGDQKAFLFFVDYIGAAFSNAPSKHADTTNMSLDELAKLYSEMIKKPK
ncbi:MAG: hypothetical protein KGZ91_00220 [Afipia sp.]|nr:hypothetical protein [Afipia sp.]